MRVLLRTILIVGATVLIGTIFASSIHGTLANSSVFQSAIPTPPNDVNAIKGGGVFCGAARSATWLDIPSKFTTEGTVQIHCDVATSLSSRYNVKNAWSDRGYLIGIYLAGRPLLKPIRLTFKIDHAQMDKTCPTCWSGVYYNNGKWLPLETVVDKPNSLIYVVIPRILPAANYPTYVDRFLVALLTQPVTLTTTVTPMATLAATRIHTLAATAMPTNTPTPMPTLAATAMPTNPPTPRPSITPPTRVTTSSPIPSSTPKSPDGGGVNVSPLLAFGLLGAVVIVLAVRRLRKQ